MTKNGIEQHGEAQFELQNQENLKHPMPNSVKPIMCVLVAQSGPVLCGFVDCSPPGFSVYGILQARILEWVTVPFSRGSS